MPTLPANSNVSQHEQGMFTCLEPGQQNRPALVRFGRKRIRCGKNGRSVSLALAALLLLAVAVPVPGQEELPGAAERTREDKARDNGKDVDPHYCDFDCARKRQAAKEEFYKGSSAQQRPSTSALKDKNSFGPPPALFTLGVPHLPGETESDYKLRVYELYHAKRALDSHPSTSTPSIPLWRSHLEFDLFNNELVKLNAEHPEAVWWTIEYQPDSKARFTLRDETGVATLLGNDPGEMVGSAIEKTGLGRAGVAIGFRGFTPKEFQAFEAELKVKQALRNGPTWRPLWNLDGYLWGLYQERGMKVDGVILDQSLDGWWRARTKFSNANRSLWVQTWLSSKQYLKEFVTSLLSLGSGNSNQSAQDMVEKSKRQLMRNHPELTEKQFYMNIREEIEQFHLGEVARRAREAA